MHTLVKILSLGVKQLQEDPQRPCVAGLPRQTYEILVTRLTGQENPLQSAGNIKLMGDRLVGLPEESVQLKGLLQTYKILRVHTHDTNVLLRSVEGVVLPAEIEKTAVNFLPQQVAFASIAAGLAEEHLGNDALLLSLGRGVLNHDIIADKTSGTLTENLGLTIQKAGGSAGVNFTTDTTKTLTKKAASSVNKLTEKPSSLGMYASLFMATTSLMVGFDAESQSNQQPEVEQQPPIPVSTPPPAEITTAFPVTLPAEMPPQPAPSTISMPSFSGLKSLFSSVSGGLTSFKNLRGLTNTFKNLWSAAKIAASAGATAGLSLALELGKRALSALRGLFSGGGLADSAQSLKKAGFVIGTILVAVILIPLLISNFITTLINPTPVATSGSRHGFQSSGSTALSNNSSNCQTGVGGGESYPGETCPVDITPIISVYPTPVNSTGNVPQGFPVSSSCVTQPPGGSFSHTNLNAVDIAPVNQGDVLVIRTTHSGKVIWVGDFGGYGLAVLLEDSDKRYITYYGHLLPGNVKVNFNDQVDTGTELGIVDSRGVSTGNHLHYEIRGQRDLSLADKYWGGKTGEFGEIGTIMNFIPACQTWSCQWFCNK